MHAENTLNQYYNNYWFFAPLLSGHDFTLSSAKNIDAHLDALDEGLTYLTPFESKIESCYFTSLWWGSEFARGAEEL